MTTKNTDKKTPLSAHKRSVFAEAFELMTPKDVAKLMDYLYEQHGEIQWPSKFFRGYYAFETLKLRFEVEDDVLHQAYYADLGGN